MSKVLIVEDDNKIAQLEQAYLEMSHYETTIITDGRGVIKELREEEYNLVLLDIMLPGIDGLTLCKQIRNETDIPILFVTAKTEAIDVIRGLGIGADDYITKPFDPAQLVARVKAHIMRYERLVKKDENENDQNKDMITVKDVVIFPKNYKVFKRDEEIRIPGKEFEILLLLARNPNVVFSREQIFEKIWGYDFESDAATVSVHINHLREKIEDNAKNPDIIQTVWGVGYRLNL